MNKPLVSVIVPVYNVANYLEKCINSIVNQTYENLQIILVNDGSEDNSGLICDYYSQIDHRIHVIHKKNGGLSDARNVGLDITKGKYVMFVDSDDWIDKEMISYATFFMDNSEYDIVQVGYIKVYDVNNIELERNGENVTEISSNKGILKHFYLNNKISSIVCDKIFKSTLFDNLRFPLNQTLEDHYLLSDIFMNSSKILISNRQLYFYFQRENSIMNLSKNLKHMHSSFKAYENKIKVANLLVDKELKLLAIKGLASDFFQYYRLIYFYVHNEKKEMYKLLSNYHKLYFSKIMVNTQISFKFKLMLSLLFFKNNLIKYFVTK